jgi:hypothetical protein
MVRRVKIPVRSMGSEVEDPNVETLASWIAIHRGTEADLITYKLEESYRSQQVVEHPAAGGCFYGSRILQALEGCSEGQLREEPAVRSSLLLEDGVYLALHRKGIWGSLPAPQLLEVNDAYFRNPEEFEAALCLCYQEILRTQRDAGMGGHILLSRDLREEELDRLSGPKVFFYLFQPNAESLGSLLEHQRDVAISPPHLPMIVDLMEEYEVRRLILLDPKEEDLTTALQYIDREMLMAGGYCTSECSTYWNTLAERAYVKR